MEYQVKRSLDGFYDLYLNGEEVFGAHSDQLEQYFDDVNEEWSDEGVEEYLIAGYESQQDNMG